jgi:hypothetical protein
MPKVSVPQAEGEISIQVGGDPRRSYAVKNGQVEVEEADLPLFLVSVDNATLVEEGAKAHPPKTGDNKDD